MVIDMAQNGPCYDENPISMKSIERSGQVILEKDST